MNVDTFFKYWGLEENPFQAEEARDDPVYLRMMGKEMTHPDFEKIYGSPTRPSTSVVFGDKGSGKTAIRLLIEQKLEEHNRNNPEKKVWIVRNDDLNLLIDRVMQATGNKEPTSKALGEINLADHMDHILSLSTTRLVDFLLGNNFDLDKAGKLRRNLKRMDRQKRIDLAELAMIYDQPRTSKPMLRWNRLKHNLRVARFFNLQSSLWLFLLSTGAALGLLITSLLFNFSDFRVNAALVAAVVTAVYTGFNWMRQNVRCAGLAKRIHREVRVVDRSSSHLKVKLSDLSPKDLESQPLPVPGDSDSRYELTTRLMHILQEIGYVSMIIIFDRIDEPVSVNGQRDKMKAVIWPLFNNKFLQQDGIGMKLLLPYELGHLVKREDSEFYQQARLDKQNMIERLVWSGTTLYDVASNRLLSCLGPEGKVRKLNDLFEEDVSKQDLIDALDHMMQPRDAFKFLYSVIQEHCHNAPEDTPAWRIPKLVLDQTRKKHAQRLQEFYRGLAPG